MQLRVLAFVLAGGKGTRLYPLTKERAKPAVPFGGRYRIVDFVLSNLINSGIYSIYVLVQFKSQSLLEHLREGWEASSLLRNHFIIPVPAQMRSAGEDWYRGTADAIYQNINLIEQAEPHVVAIFGADHIYRMNIREMIEFHIDRGAQVTVSAIPVEKEQAVEFGVIETREDGLIWASMRRNPTRPPCRAIPTGCTRPWGIICSPPSCCWMNCAWTAKRRSSSHDFGRDILPGLIGRADMYAYDFQTNRIPGDPAGAPVYWRDVGTLDAFFDANMDLRSVSPELNLYNRQWPLRTAGYFDAPAKFIFDSDGRRGEALDSIVSGGSYPVRRAGPDLGDRPGRARPLACRSGGFHHLRQLRHRTASPGPAGHSRQERARPSGHFHRVRPGTRPPALSRHRERNCRGGGLSVSRGYRQHEPLESVMLAFCTPRALSTPRTNPGPLPADRHSKKDPCNELLALWVELLR